MEQRPGQGWRERGRVAGKQRNENAVVDTWEPSWEIRKGMKSSEWSWEWNVLLTEYERPLFFYGTVKHVLRREDDHCMKSMISSRGRWTLQSEEETRYNKIWSLSDWRKKILAMETCGKEGFVWLLWSILKLVGSALADRGGPEEFCSSELMCLNGCTSVVIWCWGGLEACSLY